MANRELNRLKVVLAEKEKNQQMAWRTTGEGQDHHIKMVHEYLSARLGQPNENSKTA